MIYLPGNGFNNPESTEVNKRFAANIANVFNKQVIMLDYPLGPYPISVNAARLAIEHIQRESASYNIDLNRVQLIGFSSGGAVAANIAHEMAMGRLLLQCEKITLISPILDCVAVADADLMAKCEQSNEDFICTIDTFCQLVKNYVGKPNAADHEVSPLLMDMEDLTLPKTVLVYSEYENSLIQEGVCNYNKKLKQASQDVKLVVLPGPYS